MPPAGPSAEPDTLILMDPKALRRAAVPALAVPLLLAACSDSSDDGAPIVPQQNFSSEGLDALAPDDADPAPQPAPEPRVIDQATPPGEPTDDERTWEQERQSQSGMGKARDTVRTLTNRMQDGVEAQDGLAATTPDEEWVGTGGVRWDMPADWRMAMPGQGRFGQMQVPSPLGAAAVAFTRESASVAELERQATAMLVSMTGGRVTPRTESFEVAGRPVRTLAMEGSLVDPTAKGGAGETPFQAVRAAIVDLGDARALIVLWGPEDTVRNNEAKFNAMVRGMREP